MYLCYIDESGTPDIPGNTSHFILAGLAIPIDQWKFCDGEINTITRKFGLENLELHIAWLLRPYREQARIPNFEKLDYPQRKSQVESLRKAELLRLQRAGNPKSYKQIRKTYKQTENYIHLTYQERRNLVTEIASCVSKWKFARIFAECVNKIYFDPARAGQTINEQSFEQIISRFEQYLQIISKGTSSQCYGLVIHDNNETVAKKHTELMKEFHRRGTLWTKINNIIETPLFVNSQLTSMVQLADLCAYSFRRYLENNEDDLFDLLYRRADRKDGVVVGVRHYTNPGCSCKVCSSHTKTATS